MQHWRCPATDDAEFWISCKQPAFLSSFSRLQVIQNKHPCSVAVYVTAGYLSSSSLLESPNLVNLTNFNSFSSFRQFLFPWLSNWGFMKFYLKQILKISAFYLEKQKSFIPKRIWSKPWSLNRPKEFQQMAFAVPIFSEGFAYHVVRQWLSSHIPAGKAGFHKTKSVFFSPYCPYYSLMM